MYSISRPVDDTMNIQDKSEFTFVTHSITTNSHCKTIRRQHFLKLEHHCSAIFKGFDYTIFHLRKDVSLFIARRNLISVVTE